ncbi:hypothetical protein V2J09_003916 [Rumex salicifolius]
MAESELGVVKQFLDHLPAIEGSSSSDFESPAITSYNQISPWALDIGGTLIKLVYFSRDNKYLEDDAEKISAEDMSAVSNSQENSPILNGKLHFAIFESSNIDECFDFIRARQLNHCRHQGVSINENIIVKATGGGAFKFADVFKEKLGVGVDKEDEMDCLVAGANFLLKTVHHEAYMYADGRKEFVQIDPDDLFPYLLVNIGSGVSMIKVDGDGQIERVSGTNIGGGTFWGLGKLLTKCKSFDELLEMSHQGNNRVIDMLVGDIYGGMEYAKIGLSATAIASSFGKVISDDRELDDYQAEDMARSLLRLISNNVAQIAYLNALLHGLKRIFFAGFFIRGQEYTMDTISAGVQYWSKGEAKAMFLRHEGFLGALGAFKSYEKHGLGNLMADHFIEQSPVLSPHIAKKIHFPSLDEMDGNVCKP